MRHGRLAPLAFAALFLLAACGGKKEQAPPPTPQVSVAVPLQQSVIDWDDFTGRFESPQRVEVRARAGGYVQAVHFRDGQYVRRGQLLFTLDPRQAQAALAAARAQAQQARADLQRTQTLLAAQAASREEFESRRAASLVADATLRARQLDLEFTRVTAPVSGVVSDRRVDPGNLIAGGTSAGDILTTIVSTTPIHFTFDASEAQFLKYLRQSGTRGGARVQVRLADETDYRWNGRIDFSDNAVDEGSGAVRMRAVIDNPGGFLKPGMFGRARMEGTAPYTALLIPETAVVSDGPRKVAYVVGADGTVNAKPLDLGPLDNGMRVVRSGLRPDDRVIVNGIQRARPGQKVQARQTVIRPATGALPDAPTARAAASTTATSAN